MRVISIDSRRPSIVHGVCVCSTPAPVLHPLYKIVECSTCFRPVFCDGAHTSPRCGARRCWHDADPFETTNEGEPT